MQPEKQSKNKYLTKLIICPLGKGWKTSKKLCSCGHHHSDQMWARAQVCEVILSFSEGSDFDLAQVIYWSAKIGLRGHRKVVFSQLISRKGAFFIRFCARFSNLSFHNKKKVLTLSFKWNFWWYIELWSMCIKILQRLFTFYECSWMLSSNTLVRRWEGYDSLSDVGEIRVWFASKILTPCRMHWNAFMIAQIIAKCHSFPNMYGML